MSTIPTPWFLVLLGFFLTLGAIEAYLVFDNPKLFWPCLNAWFGGILFQALLISVLVRTRGPARA